MARYRRLTDDKNITHYTHLSMQPIQPRQQLSPPASFSHCHFLLMSSYIASTTAEADDRMFTPS